MAGFITVAPGHVVANEFAFIASATLTKNNARSHEFQEFVLVLFDVRNEPDTKENKALLILHCFVGS